MRERELAEKRRKAPGWLDRDEKILMPARQDVTGKDEGKDAGVVGGESTEAVERNRPKVDLLGDDEGGATGERGADLGAQMDRAFGGLG